MGRQLFNISLGIFLAALTTNASGEEKSKREEIDFTLQSGADRQLHWGLKFPDGKKKEFPEAKKREIFEKIIFPRVLEEAEADQEPAVWRIGYFYLDGQGTEKNIEKAEAAFRRGMDRGHPDGMIFFGEYFQQLGIDAEENGAKKKEHFARSEEIFREILEAGHPEVARFAIPLATAHLFGWYGLEPDPEKADSLLQEVEKVTPENPTNQLWRAKVFIRGKRYSEAFDYAEKAESGLEELEPTEDNQEKLKLARAVKISAAVLGGEIAKIDPEEFLVASKESLGLTGKGAWAVPLIVLLILLFLLWRTRISWNEGEGRGPGLRLSLMWLSAAVLAAGIGFNISLPGLNNALGHWIGAILVTIVCLVAMSIVGWSRYFGPGIIFRGAKPVFLGLGIIIVGLVGMQLIAMGYGKLYEVIVGHPLDQQLVSLLMKSDNLIQLSGSVLIIGIAIPFYEEIFFRGFLFDALKERWSPKVALVGSSVIFALVHGLTFFVPLLFLSFALGWLRLRNGNLRMSFALHAANNTFAVFVGYFLSGSGG